jgi:hypothetical protein
MVLSLARRCICYRAVCAPVTSFCTLLHTLSHPFSVSHYLHYILTAGKASRGGEGRGDSGDRRHYDVRGDCKGADRTGGFS